ncbi:unnamed protein product [Caenorhabditis brenneri]
MSHINLYSQPTEQKNTVRCRFCEKRYKVDNGSSGFIRHLRCKHPNLLHKMGNGGGVFETSRTDQTQFQSDLFSLVKTEFPFNGVTLKTEVVEEEDPMNMSNFSSNDILVNLANQMGFENNYVPINRIGEKRPRTSSTSNTFSNLSINRNEERSDEPGPKQFNGNTLEQFLADIDIKFKNQQQEEQEVNEEAIASVATLDVSNSPKSSREPSPNSSNQGDLNESTESVHSPIQLIHNPLTPFGCVFCPCSFPRINDLTTHIAHVHRTKYRCNTCLAEFVQPQHLEQHYTTCHVSDSTPNSQ